MENWKKKKKIQRANLVCYIPIENAQIKIKSDNL